ncbi:MAG: sigma-70 family RNA polymerase sigma factor, partial [Pseudomonadota bacterium]
KRYVRSTEDADEIVQEAFWQVWKTAEQWKPGQALFSTWLYRVAVNRSIDRLRRNKRRFETAVGELPDMEAPAARADVAVEDKQSLTIMQQAIDRLPDKQRLAVMLSTHEEQSNAAIAVIMGGSEGSVEQLLVRARRSLRDIYRELS